MKKEQNNFPIVCLGGSAGAFPSLESFFSHLPSDTGMAYIVIMHLSPQKPSMLPNIIQRFTALPVNAIKSKMKVEPNQVYVIPPGKDIHIKNRCLLLSEQKHNKGMRMPIDHFMESLANDVGEKAAGIILSGMDSDGEQGIKAIKEKLGLAIAQSPETAEYYSMPATAIETAKVDYILSPDEMPEYLVKYMNHPAINGNEKDDNVSQTRVENSLNRVFVILRNKTGNDFSQYKRSTILRRIERRIAALQLKDIVEYVQFLRQNEQEVLNLFNELLIGVTKFFRDEDAFEELKVHFEAIVKKKKPHDIIRVWSAGCSTGEEAYSIAMVIHELLEKHELLHTVSVQIFATDLDPAAIDKARQGQYAQNIVAYVSEERLKKFFIKNDPYYRVRKELRDMVIFAQHNIVKDAPFTRLDLLSCRNLLIYLSGDLQKKLIPTFYYSLNPDGLLFLGPAENVTAFMELFSVKDSRWKIFRQVKSDLALNRLVDFNFVINRQEPKAAYIPLPAKAGKENPAEELFYRTLLNHHTPTAFLLNDKGDILYINGNAGKYLEITTGQANLNINRLSKPFIRTELSRCLQKAVVAKQKICKDGIKVKEGDEYLLFNITVYYIESPAPLAGLFILVIEQTGSQARIKHSKAKTHYTEEYVEELQEELQLTKQQLQSTMEQMESSVEELKSTNEELQSTNEELQSTNEEAITTREEMQSLNEELMTMNSQHEVRTEELMQANNDMKNLLDSTQIATIFLDTDLNILRYTPRATKIAQLIKSDIGRPITHLANNLKYESLEADVKQVLATLSTKELDVQTEDGMWYNMRIMPYRTIDNFISGAVVTFTDINAQKAMQDQYELIHNLAETLSAFISIPLLILDEKLKLVLANKIFIKTFNLNVENMEGRPITDFYSDRWSGDKMIKHMENLIKGKKPTFQTAANLTLPDGSSSDFIVRGQKIELNNSDKTLILLTLDSSNKKLTLNKS